MQGRRQALHNAIRWQLPTLLCMHSSQGHDTPLPACTDLLPLGTQPTFIAALPPLPLYPRCQRKGATELLSAVSALAAGSPGVEVVPCKCVGACSKGAAMRVRQQGQRCAVYTQLTPQQLPGIFAQHFEQQQQGSGGQEARVVSGEEAPAVTVAVAEAGAVGVAQHPHPHHGHVVGSGAEGEDEEACALPSLGREPEPCCVECHSFSLVEH